MTHSGGKPHTNVAVTSACHGLSSGDVVRIDLPRPAWWRPVALWRWWRSPLRKQVRVADVTSTTFTIADGPKGSLCYDCGASIIAADDEALICIQCGGRNRRVGHRVGSNPLPPVGAKPAPSPLSYPPMPKVKPPGSAIVAPLTADEVRKIVREEIERALRPGAGEAGPG